MAFDEDLKRINWNKAPTLPEENPEENPNSPFKTFLNIFDRLIDKNIALKNPFPKQNIKQNLNHG